MSTRGCGRSPTYGFCIVTGTPADDRGHRTAGAPRRVRAARRSSAASGTSRPTCRRPTPPTPTSSCSPTPTAPTRTTRPGCSSCTASRSTAPAGCRRWSTGSASPSELRSSRARAVRRARRASQVPGQYIGDGSHLMASRPVFRHDHSGELVQVSFNNADRAPFLLPADEMELFYDALRAFEALANDHRLQWRRVNPPGDAMLFDNWRVLHGRTAVHRPSPPVRRLHQPRGLREPAPPRASAIRHVVLCRR